MKNSFVLLSLCAGLAACGGGSSSNNNSPDEPNIQTGVFLDSPVVNIGYRTETLEGVTNSLGEYEYIEGENVTFFIGELELPAANAAGTVTPLDIAGSYDTTNSTVVNILRLLQTLDEDGNPDNGITITDTAKVSATQVDFSLSESAFETSSAVVNLVANSGSSNATLISSDDAISHFEEQLEESDISFGKLIGPWELPNESVIFMYLPDGRYFAIQWEEENNFVGFERGTYQESDTEITFNTLQNNDGEALVCNEPSSSTCSGEVWGFSVSGNALTLNPAGEDSVAFQRGDYTSENLQGVWELPNESVIFMYLPDGRYFAIQWEEENNFIGFERGTYQKSDTEITFNTVQNNDGEALVCNEPSSSTCSGEVWGFSVSGNELTLNPDDGGSVVLKRLF